MDTGSGSTFMRWRVIFPVLLIWLLLASACGSGQEGSRDRGAGKESIQVMSDDYVRKYADARRSSFQNVSSESTGEVAWQLPLVTDDQPAFSPEAILYSKGRIVAYGGNSVAGFDAGGKRLWLQSMRTGSPISIFGGNVYFRENGKPLEVLSAYTLDGVAVDKTMNVLDAYDVAMPVWIDPLADGFLAMCLFRPMPEEGEPETSFYKKEYETLDYGWVADFKGTPRLLPLHIPGLNRLVVFSPEEIIAYNTSPGEDIEEEEELSRFAYPIERISGVSCDTDGNLYLLGRDEAGGVLLAVDGQGTELWRWREGLNVPQKGDVQPPAIGPENLVHIVSGTKILTLADGKLLRTFETDGEMVQFLTVLADGSLLVAAGTALYRADGNGEVVFSLEFDYAISAPPVADEHGNVYVASLRDLTRVE